MSTRRLVVLSALIAVLLAAYAPVEAADPCPSESQVLENSGAFTVTTSWKAVLTIFNPPGVSSGKDAVASALVGFETTSAFDVEIGYRLRYNNSALDGFLQKSQFADSTSVGGTSAFVDDIDGADLVLSVRHYGGGGLSVTIPAGRANLVLALHGCG